MENKINIARFKEDYRTAEVKGIWQWDYGQILRIQGLNLPTAVEIHFSLDEHGGEAVRRIGLTKDGVTDVPIPDSMVENESVYGDSYYFFAYIYLTDETSGNTEYKIRAKVSTRSKPEGFVSGGNDTFAEILKTVNDISSEKVDIPAPAKVGQVIAVSEVDEEGRPTGFEATDQGGGVSDEKIAEAVGTYMEAHPLEETDPTVPEWAKQPEKPSYTAEEVGALPAGTKIPSKTSDLQNDSKFTTLELDETLTDNTKAAPAGMVGELKGDLEQLKQNGTGTGAGLSTEAIDKLEEVGNYLVYTTADGGSKWTELISILRNGSSGGGSGGTEVTLSSISATYTGGDVAVGTALTDLTGITVTGTYSDGSTSEITGYTLSGEILEGSNTITVSYNGLTTTFTIIGIAEGTEVISLSGIQLSAVPSNFKTNEAWQYAGNSGNLHSVIGTKYMYSGCVFTGTVYVRSIRKTPFMGVSTSMYIVAEDYITNQTAEGEVLTATIIIDKFDNQYLGVFADGSYEFMTTHDILDDGAGGYVYVQQFDIPDGKYAILAATNSGTGNGNTINIDGWNTIFFENPIDHITVTEVTE